MVWRRVDYETFQSCRQSQGMIVKEAAEAVEGNLVLCYGVSRDDVGDLPSFLQEDAPRQSLLPKRQGQSQFFYVL